MERLNLRTRDRKRMGIEGLQIFGECIFIERERERGGEIWRGGRDRGQKEGEGRGREI